MRSWLSWYGKPYSDLVAPALGAAGIARGDGLRVRLGPAPMDSDEVRGVGPSLPRDLQAVRSPTQDDAPWRRFLVFDAYERLPAKVIPPLG